MEPTSPQTAHRDEPNRPQARPGEHEPGSDGEGIEHDDGYDFVRDERASD